jgi:uncharacterized protein DUF3574
VRRFAPLILLLLISCSTTLYVRQQSDTIYFGTNKQHGGVVSEIEWEKFLSDVVTPRFAGFTHWKANGEWMNQSEETHVLLIVHQPGQETAIREIIEEGRRRLDQKEVLQVRADVWIRTSDARNRKSSPPQ